MDPVIEKMRDIYAYTKNLKEAGSLDQKTALDLHQEMSKQNHIFHHMGRACSNPSGRLVGIVVGGCVGTILSTFFIRQLGRFSLQSTGIMLGGGFAGSILGFNFMTRKFGNRKDYKVFQKKKQNTDEIMADFEQLFN